MSGSKGARASPDLIAACHVLHRLSMPRHPSEALSRLIVLSKTHARGRNRRASRDAGGPSVRAVGSTMSDDVFIRSPLKRDDPSFHDVNHAAGAVRYGRKARRETCMLRSLDHPRGRGWWSQTGSNRRPHACKARALPTELWPLDEAAAAVSCRPDLSGPKEFTPKLFT